MLKMIEEMCVLCVPRTDTDTDRVDTWAVVCWSYR